MGPIAKKVAVALFIALVIGLGVGYGLPFATTYQDGSEGGIGVFVHEAGNPIVHRYTDQIDEFTELTDTPSDYSGQAGKFPKVKSDETGLEWGTAGAGSFMSQWLTLERPLWNLPKYRGQLLPRLQPMMLWQTGRLPLIMSAMAPMTMWR